MKLLRPNNTSRNGGPKSLSGDKHSILTFGGRYYRPVVSETLCSWFNGVRVTVNQNNLMWLDVLISAVTLVCLLSLDFSISNTSWSFLVFCFFRVDSWQLIKTSSLTNIDFVSKWQKQVALFHLSKFKSENSFIHTHAGLFRLLTDCYQTPSCPP